MKTIRVLWVKKEVISFRYVGSSESSKSRRGTPDGNSEMVLINEGGCTRVSGQNMKTNRAKDKTK